jgi:hypothetical protein
MRRRGTHFAGLRHAADDYMWDMLIGRKERQWSPDRRPLEERGRYDRSRSSLSWGTGPGALPRVAGSDDAAGGCCAQAAGARCALALTGCMLGICTA